MLEDVKQGKGVRTTYPYPVGIWKFKGTDAKNDLSWIFLGGEVVVDFALRLPLDIAKKPADITSPLSPTWVAGYSNDVMAYIPSRRVLTEGGYEGASAMIYYGLPSSWAPDVEEKIVAEVLRQAK